MPSAFFLIRHLTQSFATFPFCFLYADLSDGHDKLQTSVVCACPGGLVIFLRCWYHWWAFLSFDFSKRFMSHVKFAKKRTHNIQPMEEKQEEVRLFPLHTTGSAAFLTLCACVSREYIFIWVDTWALETTRGNTRLDYFTLTAGDGKRAMWRLLR